MTAALLWLAAKPVYAFKIANRFTNCGGGRVLESEPVQTATSVRSDTQPILTLWLAARDAESFVILLEFLPAVAVVWTYTTAICTVITLGNAPTNILIRRI